MTNYTTRSIQSMPKSDCEGLTQDVAFDLLSNARRRVILSRLQQSEEPVDVAAVAKQIAALENDVTPEELSDKQQKRVYISLYQTHIPKLEAAGIVEYDNENGIVTATPKLAEINRYLPHKGQQRTWAVYNLLFAITASILLILVTVNAPVFASVSDGLIIWGILLSFAGFAVYQMYNTKFRPPEQTFKWAND